MKEEIEVRSSNITPVEIKGLFIDGKINNFNNLPFQWKVDLIHIMFNSRVSSQKLGATDTALCSPSLNEVKQNWRN
jgi:hypothetical protein